MPLRIVQHTVRGRPVTLRTSHPVIEVRVVQVEQRKPLLVSLLRVRLRMIHTVVNDHAVDRVRILSRIWAVSARFMRRRPAARRVSGMRAAGRG